MWLYVAVDRLGAVGPQRAIQPPAAKRSSSANDLSSGSGGGATLTKNQYGCRGQLNSCDEKKIAVIYNEFYHDSLCL